MYITVDVDVDISEFDDDDLISELEDRGWYVGPEKDWEPNEELTEDEITAILDKFQTSLPGTTGYEIYEKLRKR